MRLDPGIVVAWVRLSEKYRALNRFDEARAAIESAIQRGLHSGEFPAQLLMVNAAQGQTTGEEDLRKQMQASPEGAFNLTIFDAHIAAAHGRLDRARELLRESGDADFQHIRNLHSYYPDDPLISLAYVGQARGYQLLGDTTKARTAYQDFFALWKDADPDIPILKEAKAEYGKLQS